MPLGKFLPFGTSRTTAFDAESYHGMRRVPYWLLKRSLWASAALLAIIVIIRLPLLLNLYILPFFQGSSTDTFVFRESAVITALDQGGIQGVLYAGLWGMAGVVFYLVAWMFGSLRTSIKNEKILREYYKVRESEQAKQARWLRVIMALTGSIVIGVMTFIFVMPQLLASSAIVVQDLGDWVKWLQFGLLLFIAGWLWQSFDLLMKVVRKNTL